MNKLNKTLCLILSLLLIFAMTACTSESEPAEDQETASDTVEETVFDIGSGLTENVDGDSKTIDTDHFTLTLSLPDTWAYVQDNENMITFYNIAGKEADAGGRLFTLLAFEPDDKSYENLPHYSVVGESNGKVYVAEYPSDVQADVQNEQHRQEYETVYAEVSKIEANAADSPLILK